MAPLPWLAGLGLGLSLGAVVRGYALFDQQDTESAVDGQGLFLSYGANSRSADDWRAIAAEVVEALRMHGLQAEWNGDLARRIEVPLRWQRRRAPAPDAVRRRLVYIPTGSGPAET